MQKNNLIPELPDIINIKYINTNNTEILFNKVKDLFGMKPAQYNYPASTNLYDGTIYISNYFQKDFNNDESIKFFRKQFNNDIHKTLEYAFFHELGHLFLIEKNKEKLNKQDNSLFNYLRINIEEGFAESFAIHMMCLKYPTLKKDNKFFESFQNTTDKLSSNTCKLFSYKRHDYLQKTFTEKLKDLIKPEAIPIEQMFNPYEFPVIYKNTPFKDQNGNLITDMNVIFKKCLENSLLNNKEVILFKTTNNDTKEYTPEVVKNFQKIVKNPSRNIDELITFFHNKVNNEGFVDRIKGMKNKYLNNPTNSNKHTL